MSVINFGKCLYILFKYFLCPFSVSSGTPVRCMIQYLKFSHHFLWSPVLFLSFSLCFSLGIFLDPFSSSLFVSLVMLSLLVRPLKITVLLICSISIWLFLRVSLCWNSSSVLACYFSFSMASISYISYLIVLISASVLLHLTLFALFLDSGSFSFLFCVCLVIFYWMLDILFRTVKTEV